MRRFIVVLKPTREPDETGYTVNVSSLPGCITEGDSVDEALANAGEAIALYIDSLEAAGERLHEGDELVASVQV